MHIVPLIVGDERAALAFCRHALDLGVFAQAIRPPTVPAGTSRLRLTAMASHTPGELRDAAAALGVAARRAGIEPEQMLVPAPEPVEEPAEIETALVRAERISASQSAGSTGPFDFERDSAGGLFDQDEQAAAAAQPPEAAPPAAALNEGIEVGMALGQATAGAPTELFDFESETVRAA